MTVNVQARQLSTGLDRRIAALDGNDLREPKQPKQRRVGKSCNPCDPAIANRKHLERERLTPPGWCVVPVHCKCWEIVRLYGHEVQTSGERAVEDYPRVERGDRFSPLIPRRRWRHRHNRVLSEQFRKRISVTSLPGLHVSLHQDPMRRSVGGNDSK